MNRLKGNMAKMIAIAICCAGIGAYGGGMYIANPKPVVMDLTPNQLVTVKAKNTLETSFPMSKEDYEELKKEHELQPNEEYKDGKLTNSNSIEYSEAYKYKDKVLSDVSLTYKTTTTYIDFTKNEVIDSAGDVKPAQVTREEILQDDTISVNYLRGLNNSLKYLKKSSENGKTIYTYDGNNKGIILNLTGPFRVINENIQSPVHLKLKVTLDDKKRIGKVESDFVNNNSNNITRVISSLDFSYSEKDMNKPDNSNKLKIKEK